MNTTLIAVFLVVVISASLLYSRNSTAVDSSPDEQVIQQLNKAGSNTGKPHNIEFFFYFPTLEAAERIAVLLKKDGFSARAEHAAKGDDFVVLATKTMVPAASALVQLRKRFDSMSASEHGTYDGWGTEVVK